MDGTLGKVRPTFERDSVRSRQKRNVNSRVGKYVLVHSAFQRRYKGNLNVNNNSNSRTNEKRMYWPNLHFLRKDDLVVNLLFAELLRLFSLIKSGADFWTS